MKTLYININNEDIQSNDELEVLSYDLDSDFFFYLGEKIAKSCKVENENALITDFNIQDNTEDYQKIIAQWKELKTILFSEDCEGEFEFTLPQGYIQWLRYSEKYNHIYDNNFSHNESVISIDLKKLYEESVEEMQRKILRKLKRDDLYLDIDEIVFNDEAVTRKSSIVRTIKGKYEGIGFKAYKKWLQDNEDRRPHTTPKVCEKCGKNPCECNTNPISSDNFFPYKGFTLGETLMNEFGDDLFDNGSIIHYDLDNGVTLLGATEGEVFLAAMVDSTISSNNKLPKEWCNLLGCRFGTFREKCRRALSEKDFEIILDEDAEIIVVSPSKKYRIHLALDVDTSKFVALLITLNECPHCKSNNFALRKMNAEMHISCCSDCNEYYLPSPIDESENDEEDLELPNCPNCGSDDVDDDGSDYLQYTCNDCGHNWGNPKHDVCPRCGSHNVEDDNSGYLQYKCSCCECLWGHYNAECPECGSHDAEDDGTDYCQYRCNVCGHIWGGEEDIENEEPDNDEYKEDEYNDDIDNAGNQMSEYIESLGVIIGKSTKYDVERMGGVLVDSNYGQYKMPNGINAFFYNNNNTVNGITIYKDDIHSIPQFYRNLGIYWGIDRFGFKNIFENLGFHVEESRHVDAYITAYKPCMKYNVYICIKFVYNPLGLTRNSGEYLNSIHISTWNINYRPY